MKYLFLILFLLVSSVTDAQNMIKIKVPNNNFNWSGQDNNDYTILPKKGYEWLATPEGIFQVPIEKTKHKKKIIPSVLEMMKAYERECYGIIYKYIFVNMQGDTTYVESINSNELPQKFQKLVKKEISGKYYNEEPTYKEFKKFIKRYE